MPVRIQPVSLSPLPVPATITGPKRVTSEQHSLCGLSPAQKLSLMMPPTNLDVRRFATTHPSVAPMVSDVSREGIFTQRPSVPSISADRIIQGAHGGLMLKSSEGLIQFGGPAGVMDDMFGHYLANRGFALPEGEKKHVMPTVIVTDADFVPATTGSFPLEFTQYSPFIIYPNFTAEHTPEQRMRYVTEDAESADRLRNYLRLSYEGPRDEELPEPMQEMERKEYPKDYPQSAIPNMRAELDYFHTVAASDLADVQSFDEHGVMIIGNVTIMKDGPLNYLVWDKGELLGRINLAQYQSPPRVLHPSFDHSRDPEFQRQLDLVLRQGKAAIMPISTANGFTGGGGESTSGFLKWNNGRAIIVDPPLHTLEFLITNRIPLSAIAGMHFTHGHGDHFTAAASEILNAIPDIPIYAGSLVMAMTQLQYDMALGDKVVPASQWNARRLGKHQFEIVNGEHWFLTDGFHSVPATGFEIWDMPDERSGQPFFVFSGDTAISEEVLDGTISLSVMSEERRRVIQRPLELLRTDYRRKLTAYIETGAVEPKPRDPHTALPSMVREIGKIEALGHDVSGVRYYHTKAANVEKQAPGRSWPANSGGFVDLSDDTGLDWWSVTAEHANDPSFGEAKVISPTVVRSEIAHLLHIGLRESYKNGQVLMNAGDKSRDVYVVLQGSMVVTVQGKDPILLTRGDVLGEMAYVAGGERSATVRAQSLSKGKNVEVLRIPAIALDELVRQHPEVLSFLTKLAQERKSAVA